MPAALEWARARGISAADAPSYLHEYEHLTLARALLAHHATGGGRRPLTEATALLDRLLAAAEAGGRTGSVIEILVLRAVALGSAGEAEQASASLERAVRLAEPEGYVQVFADVPSPPVGLLQSLARRHRTWTFVRHLAAVTSPPGRPAATRPSPEPDDTDHRLLDPLSGRELDVLRYLASDLDGPGIARELGVSLTTVRTHTQHVYTKLGVTSRRAAVRRAHQLSLFSRTAPR